jgi:hypothetical protein
MTNTLTIADALDDIHKQVEAAGAEYVYSRPGVWCVYVHDGQPSCMIGRIAVDRGASLEALKLADDSDEEDVHGLLENLGYVDDAISVWMVAQAEQDNGKPWGEVESLTHTFAHEYFQTEA